MNNKDEWEVEDIFDARSHEGKLKYWVKWVNWDENREWYDVIRLKNFLKNIENFLSYYLEKQRSEIPAIQKVGGKETEY